MTLLKRHGAPIAAGVLTALLLGFVRWKVKTPVMLLAERFWPGPGAVEILILALYAGWITGKILDPTRTATWRRRIWTLFSLVFFGQLVLGLAGVRELLMTGKLHLPVPAMILAGPLFRGAEFFMTFLFGATVVLVGPAWCSYLCYIGAWDNLAAVTKKIPRPLPRWRQPVRIGLLVLVAATALGLNLAGVSGWIATLLGGIFGLAGVAIMVIVSRRTGTMAHCVAYCPIGFLANLLGRLSPFRVRIKDDCTGCGACRTACRYDALGTADIANRKPGSSCTLCGDCIGRCHENSLHYTFPGMTPRTARRFFMVLVVALHAVFLGVARL